MFVEFIVGTRPAIQAVLDCLLKQLDVVPVCSINDQRNRGACRFGHQRSLRPQPSAIRRVFPSCIAPQGGLGHRAIDTLPRPIQANPFVILRRSHLPKSIKLAIVDPLLKTLMCGASRSQAGRDGFPLTSRSPSIENSIRNTTQFLARASSRWAHVRFREQRLNSVLHCVGQSVLIGRTVSIHGEPYLEKCGLGNSLLQGFTF